MIAMRLACCASMALAVAILTAPSAQAKTDCAAQISKLLSRQVERLSTRYHRISERMEREGSSPKLVAQSCQAARALEPHLREQLIALKKSGCAKDPDMGMAVADLMRGQEADLAKVRKSAATNCK